METGQKNSWLKKQLEKVKEAERVEKTKIRCLSCNKEVEVVLTLYGESHIATCPECKKLVYNGE